MRDPYPSMPTREYTISRALRLLVFSFVASALIVSAFVVVFRWVWDSFLAEALNRDPYQVRVELVLPAIGLLTLVLAYSIWFAANPRKAKRGGA